MVFQITRKCLWLLVVPFSLHAVIFDKITIWRKKIPETGLIQYIYNMPAAHEETIIARDQVKAIIKANRWLKQHNQQPLQIISEGYDTQTFYRRSPLLSNYEQLQSPCSYGQCPVEFFNYLFQSFLRLRLCPIDFRLISAHASNVFECMIKSAPEEVIDSEFCTAIKYPQIMRGKNIHERVNLFCSYAGLTMNNLYNEYLNMRSEIIRYDDGPLCQYFYNAIIDHVDQNANIVFEHCSPQLGRQPVYDYIMRNTTLQERQMIDLDAEKQPRTLCGLLYKTLWLQNYIDARTIHIIHNASHAQRIVLTLGEMHIRMLEHVLPHLGYENIGERKGEAFDANDNELNENGSYLEPKVIFDLITATTE